MRAFGLLWLTISMALTMPAAAVLSPGEVLKDPGLEQRARALSRELRCMVCQNQSIDDSDAPLARDLRLLVRQRLQAGDTDSQVIAFLTDRYGDFVLMRPRFDWHTALLWLAPLLVLLAGLGALIGAMRRRRDLAPETGAAPLSDAEHRRLDELLGNRPEIRSENPRTD